MSVELPKDAEGREVQLDTTTLYDEYGRPLKVCSFQYSTEFKRWLVRGWFNATEMSSRVSRYYLTAPDSWERLLDDLDKAASKTSCGTCDYFGKNPADCRNVRHWRRRQLQTQLPCATLHPVSESCG